MLSPLSRNLRTCTHEYDLNGLHYRSMNDPSESFMRFLKGQEICQIAFGMYDLQINWGNGGLSCTGRVLYEPREGAEVVWTEGHPFDGVPVLRLNATDRRRD